MELKGKIIDFLGDSITEGHSVEDIPNNRYDNVLKRLCGLKEVMIITMEMPRLVKWEIKPVRLSAGVWIFFSVFYMKLIQRLRLCL